MNEWTVYFHLYSEKKTWRKYLLKANLHVMYTPNNNNFTSDTHFVKYYCITTWSPLSCFDNVIFQTNLVCFSFLLQSFLLHTSCRVFLLDWYWEVSWSTIGGEQRKEEFSPSPASTQVRHCQFEPTEFDVHIMSVVVFLSRQQHFNIVLSLNLKDPTGWQHWTQGKEAPTLATITEPTNR